jgi:hypothetical protein
MVETGVQDLLRLR